MPAETPPELQSPSPERCVFDNTSACHPKPCLTEAMRTLGTHLGDLSANDHYSHQTREYAILVMREMMNCALAKMPALAERADLAEQRAKTSPPSGRR